MKITHMSEGPTCAECGREELGIVAANMCGECYASSLQERLGALDDREHRFRQLSKVCGKTRRVYKRYRKHVICLRFLFNYTQTRSHRLTRLIVRCERMMDACGVPEDMYLFPSDDEEIVYLSEVESEPEASFTDSEEENSE